MKRRLLSLAVAGTALLTGLAQAGPQIAEVRGDFYFDKDGALIGHRNADLPENLERRPMSHREKYELMGLQLPSARGALEARTIFAKPARVDDRPQMSRELVIVKFKDEEPVRLRDGKLRSASKSLAAVDEILGRYPEARVERLFRDVEERILDENKESGERLGGKQLADLNNFYAIRFDTPNELAVTIANELLALDDVETAYLQAPGTTPACADIAPTTPNWTASQNYLDPAPAGLDAEAAWAYHAGGNGYGPGYWVCDLEWQWCYGHEDIDIDVTDVLNGNVGNNTASMNHGTAVLGEIGACSNSYGMTGMTPDVTLKMADFDAAGSWANNIATADAFLVSGEVMLLEIHIVGPNSGVICDPTCTTCPPDPNSQFEFVPVEWDAASFAAIQTAVANGIVVVEAAGNGSMNLDSAVYGGWFNPTTHNSGAIMVGAGVNSTHSPHCWSNAGSRVNFHGYGNGVYTAGYGGLFNQTGCEQDYTSSFSGTSSASPMITGAVASVQGVAKAKYGVTLSPSQIKEALGAGGTAQGPPTTRNIGVMPNLVWAINWIEPDMRLPTPTGWSFPTVPLASATGTFTSAPLGAAAIAGNVDATYWCAVTENAGYSFTPTINDPDDRIYYSDVWQVQGIRPNHAPGERTYLLNYGPLNVRGGRQTIRQYIDFDFVEDEWSETNNEFIRQFIWTGRALTANAAPLLLTAGPYALSTGWGPYYNAEGLQGTSGGAYWNAFGVCPTGTTTDLDIRLNTEAPSNIPQAGWGANVAWSSSGDGLTDFVGFNRNAAPSGTYYASVLNFEATGASSERVEFVSDPGLLLGVGTWGPFTLGANEIVNLHECYLAGGQQYRVRVEWVTGSVNHGVSMYSGDMPYFSKTTTMPGGYANAGGTGANETIIVDVPTTDFHGIAVWKNGASDLPNTLSYRIVIDTRPNLTWTTPSGWYGPIVPRNTTDATVGSVPLPAVLTGETPTTSFNWNTFSEGPNTAVTPWETRLYVDDFFSWYQGGTNLAAGSTQYALNTAPGFDPYSIVRGGRHHLRSFADAVATLDESVETDNQFTDWFVWTSATLPALAPTQRSAPPIRNPIGYGQYSCDGLRAATPNTFWSVTGVIPTNAADDYDVRLHERSTGSKDGFGAYLAWSADGIAGNTDFVVSNYNIASALGRDLGVINWNAGAGDYVIETVDAPYVGAVSTGFYSFGPYSVDANHVLNAQEFYVDPLLVGSPLFVSMDALGGTADLDVEIFGPVDAFSGKYGGMARGSAIGATTDEHLSFVPDAGGYYCAVVQKKKTSDLLLASEYRLVISTTNAVDSPVIDGTPDRFALAAPQPNPFGAESQIRYDVPANGGRVALSVYDLRGRRVATLVDGVQPAGRHSVRWNGADSSGRRIAAGVYFLRLESAEGTSTKKITLLR